MSRQEAEERAGPPPHLGDLQHGSVLHASVDEDRDRVRRIAEEAEDAFQCLRRVRSGVTVFGSAQPSMVERWGPLARELGTRLAGSGFTVITGGGPGLMAEANQGAKEADGTSIGLTIELPEEQRPNPYLSLHVPFHYFFLRKLALVRYSCAFVLLPGGFGTLDELFEALNLRRTHRLEPFPVILVGVEFWGGMLDWLKRSPVAGGALSRKDVDSITLTDDVDAVLRTVEACHRTLCRRLGIAP